MLPCGTQTSEVIGQDFFSTPMFIATCDLDSYAPCMHGVITMETLGRLLVEVTITWVRRCMVSVTDHSHAQHVANHGAPPYPDPLCSDGAPSGPLQSLLSGHGPPRKHVNFSHRNWQVKIGSPGLGCLKGVHHPPPGLKTTSFILPPYKPIHHAPQTWPFYH